MLRFLRLQSFFEGGKQKLSMLRFLRMQKEGRTEREREREREREKERERVYVELNMLEFMSLQCACVLQAHEFKHGLNIYM